MGERENFTASKGMLSSFFSSYMSFVATAAAAVVILRRGKNLQS